MPRNEHSVIYKRVNAANAVEIHSIQSNHTVSWNFRVQKLLTALRSTVYEAQQYSTWYGKNRNNEV